MTVGEIVLQHTSAYDFAHEIVRRFDLNGILGPRRNIVVVYLDPANFKNIGDGHTIADQVNEVLAPSKPNFSARLVARSISC